MKTRCLLPFFAVLFAAITLNVSAQTILIDFNSASPTAGNWNNVNLNLSIADLINDGGDNTGIALATAGFQSSQTMGTDPGVPAPTTANLDYFRAWQTVAGDPGTIGTVTLTGLATDTAFTMTLFGSRESTNGGPANRGGQYRLTGPGIVGGTQTLNIVTVDNTDTFSFSFTTAASAGNVILEIQGYDFDTNALGLGGEARGAALSSLNLTVVPEPSSLALFAIGLGGLACFRRRRA